MTRWQEREAKRLGISFQLSCEENAEAQELNRKAREIRAENIRRTSRTPRRQPSWPLFPRMIHTGAGE